MKKAARCACRWRVCWRCCSWRAIVVPYLNARQYGDRLKWSLQRSLGREVDIGQVRFSLWRGPAFVVERNGYGPGLIIHEDPAIGIEPMAYVETAGRAAELLGAPARQIRDFFHPAGGRQHQSDEAGERAAGISSHLWIARVMSTRARDPRPQRPRQLQIRRHQVDRLPDRDGPRHLAAGFARAAAGAFIAPPSPRAPTAPATASAPFHC